MRANSLSAWSGIGFENPDRLRGWKGEAEESEIFTRLAADAVPMRCAAATDPLMSRWLAGEPPADEVLLVPVCLRGKIMGAVYLDRVEGRPWHPDEAQALVALACWLIDTLPHRQTVPSAMLAEPVDLLGAVEDAAGVEAAPGGWPAEPEEAKPTEVEVAEPPEADEMELVAEPVVPVEVAEPAEVAEGESIAEPVVPVEEAELVADFDARSTVQVDLHDVPPPVSPVPEPEPEPEPVVPVEEEAPAEAPPLTAEEQAKHEEARRFARLLVSEIKLYNEEEVERGRVNKDLYHRLKEDVDRSKEMYEKRISPEVRATRDYFYEELLRILADGDPDALGM